MISKKILLSLIGFPFLVSLSKIAYAHCPLCTAGIAVAAGGAAWLGVNSAVIGLFVGALAVSIGLWVSKVLPKKYVPRQHLWLAGTSFALTVFPLLPLMKGFIPFYVSVFGAYGSLLNRTYLINIFVVGCLAGAILVAMAPWLSAKITQLRKGKTLPFQGTILTLVMLVVLAVIIQIGAFT